ncbi:hypothetical protein U1Q18_036170 [Sarracenia purpurea var. burkii]
MQTKNRTTQSRTKNPSTDPNRDLNTDRKSSEKSNEKPDLAVDGDLRRSKDGVPDFCAKEDDVSGEDGEVSSGAAVREDDDARCNAAREGAAARTAR